MAEDDTDYWLQCIRLWYPELCSRAYFLPPLHFNRVPYSVKIVNGETALVRQDVQNEDVESVPSAQTIVSRFQSAWNHFKRIFPRSIWPREYRVESLPVPDRILREDNALQRVLICLRELANKCLPQEAMVIISELKFGQYLCKPSYAAASYLLPQRHSFLRDTGAFSRLPRSEDLSPAYHQGDFDILIIHSKHGLITGEIKSVGANFHELKLNQNEEDMIIVEKIKQAIKQLSKADTVLTHLVSDLASQDKVVKISKILIMPNVKCSRILRLLNTTVEVAQDLRQCLRVNSNETAINMCLGAECLSSILMPWDVPEKLLTELKHWWDHYMRAIGPPKALDFSLYEQLVSRFCGPSTTVELHCVTPPRLEIRTEGEAISETGARMARLVLLPEQVDLLTECPLHVFLTGPPGTGKTVVLILQGLKCLQLGYEVHVVSTWRESAIVSSLICYQLVETFQCWTTQVPANVYEDQYDFENNEGDVSKAVQNLSSLALTGINVCIIADEIGPDNCNLSNGQNFSNFCDMLIQTTPAAYLWAAAVQRRMHPPRLKLVMMTTPLRSPPVIVRQVMTAAEIQEWEDVIKYSTSTIPHETDGPQIMRITHKNQWLNHLGDDPDDCSECGRLIGEYLNTIQVGKSALRYRDVLVLCGCPNEKIVDESGQLISKASGLVQGLRACGILVRVLEFAAQKSDMVDTALGISDEVTVTRWDNVRGLERKIVVTVNNEVLDRLHGISRCSSQLIVIDVK